MKNTFKFACYSLCNPPKNYWRGLESIESCYLFYASLKYKEAIKAVQGNIKYSFIEYRSIEDSLW
jgi:hypothetical protein